MKKNLIFFLVAFACVSFGVTSALIFLKNNSTNVNNTNDSPKLEVDYSLGIKDLTQKYYTNNIKTTEVKHAEGGKVWLSDYNYNQDKLSVEYYTIDGLKDKELEKKINDKIRDFAFSLIPTEEADSKNVSCYICGNFSNILSLSFSPYWYIKNDKDYDYHYGYSQGLNIDLTTGNTISLKDCFIDNANINVIVSNAIYKGLAWDEKYMWGVWNEETEEYEPVDRSSLEEDAFAAMHEINKGNYSFLIHDNTITIQTSNGYGYIDYEEIPEQIAIFNRFATKESIFDGTYDEGKEVYYGLAYASDNIHELSDNLIIIEDVYCNDWTEKDEIQSLIDARMLSEEKIAKANPETIILEAITNNTYEWEFYNNISRDYYSTTGEYNMVEHGISILRIEIPKSYYKENNIRADFFKALRNGFNSMVGEVTYALDDYFNELKEKGVLTSYSKANHGRIYTHGEWNDDNTIYTLYAQDFYPLESSTKILESNDIANLDKDELNKAYNQLFAKHGHEFASKDLKEYFYGFLWYAPESGKKVNVSELNNIEQKNLETIKSRIDELKNI